LREKREEDSETPNSIFRTIKITRRTVIRIDIEGEDQTQQAL